MVRVGFPGGPRLEWYDRNPSDVSINYTATGVAPHTITTRASYTVSSGRKAFVGGCYVEILRNEAATTLGYTNIYIRWGARNLIKVTHRDNTLYSKERAAVSISGVRLAGETVDIQTADASTDGTMNYSGCVVIMEFSA